MQNPEQEMHLMQEKLDLLMDGVQALYSKMDRQKHVLSRLEAGLVNDGAKEISDG